MQIELAPKHPLKVVIDPRASIDVSLRAIHIKCSNLLICKTIYREWYYETVVRENCDWTMNAERDWNMWNQLITDIKLIIV